MQQNDINCYLGEDFCCIFSLNKLFEANYKLITTGDEYIDAYHILYFG